MDDCCEFYKSKDRRQNKISPATKKASVMSRRGKLTNGEERIASTSASISLVNRAMDVSLLNVAGLLELHIELLLDHTGPSLGIGPHPLPRLERSARQGH